MKTEVAERQLSRSLPSHVASFSVSAVFALFGCRQQGPVPMALFLCGECIFPMRLFWNIGPAINSELQ